MKKNTEYIKVATHEGKVGEVKKVVLLYSGGLDTSCMLKWIIDQYKAEVITVTVDLGQQNGALEPIKQKALKFGASKAYIVDVKAEFAKDYLAPAIKANASYQGDYHLSTPLGRPLMAKVAVDIAKKEGADTIAHGATGGGNDQVRLEGSILALNPNIKVIAPVREWNMDRNEEIDYAQENGIPVPNTIDFPYSDDDNMWGMTWEGGEIEDPKLIAPLERFLTTYTLAANAPDKEELVKLNFENGLPISLNGKKMPLEKLIIELNKIGGKHGVGVVHLVEDRLVGVKNRGIYELPAAHIIITAHKAIEMFVSTRTLNELKQTLDIKWAYLCYGALWFDPTMQALNAFNDNVNEKVDGLVTVKLYKGRAEVVAMESPNGLAHNSFNALSSNPINVNSSAGFIEIYTLQMRLANQLKEKTAAKKKV